MISCTTFRATAEQGELSPLQLEHLRTCDDCLEHGIALDGDNLFRAIGGEMQPPGGVEAFTADVMREVKLRQKESSLEHQPFSGWTRRLALAAALATAIIGAAFFHERAVTPAQTPTASLALPVHMAQARRLTTKPVVDSYDSDSATIVEVPTEGTGDVKLVMIFDDKLPADL
jgi:anti-sigma factor RsiW